MAEKVFVVVTSIAGPNDVMREIARGCKENKWSFIVIGDKASPPDFKLDGCDFYSLDRQRQMGLRFAAECPVKHYARKNVGYLAAMRAGATQIIETDDDNIPYPQFWTPRQFKLSAAIKEGDEWVNVYKYFSDANIWPRGFPLELLQEKTQTFEELPVKEHDCPIQQGLADDNPDIDAVYRLTLPLPQKFRADRRVVLTNGAWCPFNSQNTTWQRQAFGLMYLPAYCSFRMTDIWRSFVAQRIAQANGWSLLFHEPTVRQERNEHNLLKDFKDEVPGYLNNNSIRQELQKLSLKAGSENISENLRVCYEKLTAMGLVGKEEMGLLDAWLEDMGN